MRTPALAAVALALALCAPARARAQSSDVNHPTPVFAGEVSGRIAPRDLGDPRRTRHFYAFRGTEGDVSVTLETSGLVGDVDVFTVTTLRPLIKFTLLGDSTRLSKSFYVRSEESLLLRVEARTTSDSEGTYRLTFGGSFAPAPASLADTETKEPTLAERPRDPNARRVTSAGARIEEPRPTPTPAPAEEARAAEPPAERPTARAAPNTSRRSTRNTPSRTRGAARPRPPGAESADAKPSGSSGAKPPDSSTAEANADAESPAASPARPAPRRRNTRTPRGRASGEGASANRPAPDSQPSAAAGPAPAASKGRLVIITLDGEIFEREMTAVRSVTIEKGQLVVTTLDGKTTRRPMANVLRMSVEP